MKLYSPNEKTKLNIISALNRAISAVKYRISVTEKRGITNEGD